MIPRLKADMRLGDFGALLLGWDSEQDVARFEAAFAKLADQREALAFPYGRTALMAILQALKLKEKGRPEVICPSYTCVVVPHAVTLSGLTPVFADSEQGGYNADWDFIEQATNEKTGALVVTSIFGCPVDLTALDAYRAKHPEVTIIQDCAHSFFASSPDGRFVHKEGAVAIYGLNISKIMTSIFGGMATTDDPILAEAIRAQRDAMLTPPGKFKTLRRSLYYMAATIAFWPWVYGLINRLERSGLLNRFVRYYDPGRIDLPADAFEALCPAEARIGLIQCARYDEIVAHRRKIAGIYLKELAGAKGLRLPQGAPGATWSHFVVGTKRAKEFVAQALARGVQLGELIDYEIPDMPVYKNAPYFGERRSRSYVGHVINLPVHTGVQELQARKIIELIRDCLDRKPALPIAECLPQEDKLDRRQDLGQQSDTRETQMDEKSFVTQKVTSQRDVIQFYDTYAQAWDSRFGEHLSSQHFLSRRWNSFLKLLGKTGRAEQALELGVGTGVYIEEASLKFARITAVDGSQKMLQQLTQKLQQKNINNVTPLLADATELSGIEAASVDVIYFFGLVEHILDVDKFFTTLLRVLKPGGVVIGVMPNGKCPWYNIRRHIRKTGKHCESDRYYTWQDVKIWREKYGFESCKKIYWGGVPAGTAGLPYIFLRLLERPLELSPFRSWCGGLTFKLQKS